MRNTARDIFWAFVALFTVPLAIMSGGDDTLASSKADAITPLREIKADEGVAATVRRELLMRDSMLNGVGMVI